MAAVELTEAEREALTYVMEARYENIVEARQQTGDDEYNEGDEAQCSALVAMLGDLDVDPDAAGSLEHLHDAVWVALDTPEAFEEVDMGALRSGAAKLGYSEVAS